MSETNTTLVVDQPTKHHSAFIQLITTLLSLICATTFLVSCLCCRKWWKHNYLYAKHIIIANLACCWMLIIIIFEKRTPDPDDYFTITHFMIIVYFVIVVKTVAGTVNAVALAHIYVALNSEEIADEESCVALSWYYFTALIVAVLVNVKLLLGLEIQTALSIAGILVSAITTGNVMVLSRTINNMERKCSLKITFIVFVISLGILLDVLLILYGGVLLTGSTAGVWNDLLKLACAAVILLKTVLIFCSGDAMDWKKCRASRQEEIEM